MSTAPSAASSAAHVDARPQRWTRAHIVLHWLVLGLILVQFSIGGWMSEYFDQTLNAGVPAAAPTFLGLLHMITGTLIFVAIAARLWDRHANGRPPHPPGEPMWAQRLARVTQYSLYAIVLAMPVAGMLAWFVQSTALASLHALAAKALFALILLHAAGALANKYWFKTDVLDKMLPGQGRGTDVHPTGVPTRS